jgi:hypothetical protein
MSSGMTINVLPHLTTVHDVQELTTTTYTNHRLIVFYAPAKYFLLIFVSVGITITAYILLSI